MESIGPREEKARRPGGWRICIVGTGGQGVLTAARLLCEAFVDVGHDVVSGQLHGMAQRGGSVQSSVMIDCGISPMMGSGRADFVLGFEPVETVRALPLMSSSTAVFMNTAPIIPFTLGQQTVLQKEEAEYPKIADLESAIRQATDRLVSLDATQAAIEAGSGQSLNLLLLGCLMGTGQLPCTVEQFWETVNRRMPHVLVQASTWAYHRGVALGKRLELAGTGT